MPTTYAAPRNASGKPPGGLRLPQRQQSTTVGSSIPVPPTSTVTENISSRKSLLPQRTTVPSRLPGLRKPQVHTQTQPTKNIDTNQTQPTRNTDTIQEQEPELPVVEAQPVAIAPLEPSPPPPEPIQPEPGDVKLPPQPVTVTTTTTNRPPSRPRIEPRVERIRTRSKSPVKPQQNDSKPTATKKPSMPPPARPTRSASLRQPSAPKISGVGETRGHVRHRSQILNSQAITGATPVSSAPSREKIAAATTVKPRPQFTTYQQHFSPKKEAPRTVAAGDRRNTGKSVAGSELPLETIALQTEFLQLYLLHSSSLQQSAEWKLAAERQLREKYNEVAASYKTILDEERHIQEQLNLEALYDWSVESTSLADHNHGVSFQEEIQSFSRVTQEVADMTADGAGRYALAVQVFEHWLDRVDYIHQSRENQDDDGDPQFIDSLGSVWRNEVDDLTIKAELCLRELSKMTIFVIDENEFCDKHGNSALVRIARKHRDILMCMIDELKSMRAVELETVNMEQAWIARAADQVEIDHGMSIRAGIWRTMT